jgi:serine phosphatase RsbU (regulator of sigma subunit)
MRAFLTLILLTLAVNVAHPQTSQELLDVSDRIYSADPDSSFSIALEAHRLAVEQDDSVQMAWANLHIGRYFLIKSDIEIANLKLNQSLKVFERFDEKKGQARVHQVKSILLKRIQKVEEATAASLKAMDLFRQLGDTEGVLYGQVNLSLDYLDAERFEDAKVILDEMGEALSADMRDLEYYYHQNYGIYYHKIDEYDESIASYERALVVLDIDANIDSYITLLMLKARPYIALGEFEKAKKLLGKSERLARETELRHELNETLVDKTKLYVAEGDFVRAYNSLKEQTILNQELYDLEMVSRIGSLEKRLQLSNTQQELTTNKLELAKQKMTSNWLIFIVICVVIVAGGSLLLYFRTRALKNLILNQKESIEEKGLIIEDAYKSITDSLAYSKQLQDAILPPLKSIERVFPKSFVLYLAKDVVAGDFYWMEEKGDLVFLAAADCTGHGVPGALVSVVCSNALNRCVNEMQLTDPGQILDAARELVVLQFSKSEREVRDGMDISFCIFNKKTNEVSWAGAYNPLWIIRDDELIEYKGDKQPIGNGYKNDPFTTHKITVQKDDQLYLFSDGYADQFGGTRGKKLMIGNFKKLLLSVREKQMTEQRALLLEYFGKWRADLQQVDDVCIIGVKV